MFRVGRGTLCSSIVNLNRFALTLLEFFGEDGVVEETASPTLTATNEGVLDLFTFFWWIVKVCTNLPKPINIRANNRKSPDLSTYGVWLRIGLATVCTERMAL